MTADWQKWPSGAAVAARDFADRGRGKPCPVSFDLEPGAYRARCGPPTRTARRSRLSFAFLVVDPAAAAFPVKIPFHVASRTDIVEVGQDYELFWGTGYEKGPVLIDLYQNGRRLERAWTAGGPTQGGYRLRVTESHRGGFAVVVTMVKENRLYRDTKRVLVPWIEQEAGLALEDVPVQAPPGQAETWSLEIKGPRAEARRPRWWPPSTTPRSISLPVMAFPASWASSACDTTMMRSGYSNRRCRPARLRRPAQHLPVDRIAWLRPLPR